MSIGSIVFGPVLDPKTHQYWKNTLQDIGAKSIKGDFVQTCNCVGPQPGEKKCPCSLRWEAEQGREMVQNGVIINGKRYNLVPA